MREGLLATAERLTALADTEFDEDGNPIESPGKTPRDEPGDDTIIIDRDAPDDPPGGADPASAKTTPGTTSRARTGKQTGKKKKKRARTAEGSLF